MDTDELTRSKEGVFRTPTKLHELSYLAGVGTLAAVYLITARLGLLMDAVSGFATTVWPPTGISLVALLLFGQRLWPGVAVGAFLVNASAGAPLPAALGMAAGNTLEAVLGVYLLRRFTGFRGSLDQTWVVVRFVVLAAGLSTMVSATIGVASGWLGGVIPSISAGKAWLTWWLGDAMADLILAPLLFVWAERPRLAVSAWRVAEAGALAASLVTVSLLIFGPLFTSVQASFLQPYLLFPFLIWAALRFSQRGTVTATFLVSAMAIWRTAAGFGPFAKGTVNESLLLLQAFMGVVAVTMLLLAAGITERKRAQIRVKTNYTVARALAEAPSPEKVFPFILGAIGENLEWDCGNLWTVDAHTETLRHSAEWHRPGSRFGEFGRIAEFLTFRPGVGMAGRVWSDARPLWITNLSTAENVVRGELAAHLGLRSAIGFPIVLGRAVYGVMTLFSREVREPDDTQLQMMATLANQIGEVVQRQRAEDGLRLAHAELEARIARRTAQLSEANRALQEEIAERNQAEDSLRRLSTRLLRVQDEERQRLARDLHDSTAQSLAALSMNLAVARGCRGALDRRAKDALDECDALADRCSREIRSLSYILHPPMLQEIGLPAALRWCAEGFARRSGIAVEVELPDHLDRLPMEVENALFRIVQECLTNVQRHSGSPTARIQLVRTPRSVALEVQDRGRGLPPGVLNRREAVESLGVGLLGMRERVRQLGGQLRIETSGQGATVHVEINLGPEAT
ncbi:MAG TPA: MASE1 domain-containing protein [Candidatus Polarisedimenticolia bacterium]|jgi:signal transduction histidine kinase|nr:MASE1 domain-containing protein [Candidatus Polarisedimenticolia bacterium]